MVPKMTANPVRKARTRSEIFEHAARLFRLRGYTGTNIDDIMLAAGLTRGAFYAHFKSKDDLFAEVVGAGHGLLGKARAHGPAAAVADYLDKERLGANAPGCTLASLAGDVARSSLMARLAYANALHSLIGELGRDRKRKLDGEATVLAILAIGAVVLARASGDRRLSDWLLRCARVATKPMLKPPSARGPRARPPSRQARQAWPSQKRSRSRRKGAAARRPKRAARSRGGRA
jgi:TetR/AcrR family transcriptional regulator, transcriptional repressor for nem operon